MINIFTDASITTTSNGETIGCAGAICYEIKRCEKIKIIRDSTNNIAEITAIKLAILLAIENNFKSINIWSDSQLSVYGLTKWNRSWMNNIVNYQIMNSSGDLVKNQNLFLEIMKLIINNNLRVNFFHIKGHVKEKDRKSMEHAHTVFNRVNNCNISREDLSVAVKMNNIVDHKTRSLLLGFKDIQPIKLSRGIINPILSNKDLIKYYNCVTLGGNKL